MSEMLEAGDDQAADRVGQSLVRLMGLHLAGVHRKETQEFDDDVAPVIPALVTALGILIRTAVVRSRGRALQSVLGTIEDILQVVGADGQGPALVQTLTRSANADAHVTCEMLAIAARRAMELKEPSSMSLITHELSRGAGSPDGLTYINTAADVASLGMWMDYFEATQHWIWFRGLVDLGDVQHLETVLRVGAASLEARVFSVAMNVVVDVRNHDPHSVSVMRGLSEHEGVVARERLRSELGGNFLGRSAADAIGRFARFSEVVASAVK